MIAFEKPYSEIKVKSVCGRYVIDEQINSFLETFYERFFIETIGYSVQKRPIQRITLGVGSRKVLMWSQMHGNESTTTKAILDLLNLFGSESEQAQQLLSNCTLQIIPMLNPDGAFAYTRVNANKVDLNRDAQQRTQPESKILRTIYEDFDPDFCFNLHDQRTIFSVGITPKPTTVSFLAPAHDAERSISTTRAKSMRLIVAMNQMLQQLIPDQVGRYDDAYNANCVGDTFQMLETPTLLFEAGHFPEDYEREKTREYIFFALIEALKVISNDALDDYQMNDYFNIPENQKLFFDILIKNAPSGDKGSTADVGILYEERLQEGKIILQPKIEKQGDLGQFFGHKTYNYNNMKDLEYLKTSSFWNLLHS